MSFCSRSVWLDNLHSCNCKVCVRHLSFCLHNFFGKSFSSQYRSTEMWSLGRYVTTKQASALCQTACFFMVFLINIYCTCLITSCQLLNYLVVTGATDGIGKSYAKKVMLLPYILNNLYIYSMYQLI